MNFQTATKRVARAAMRESLFLAWSAYGQFRPTMTVKTEQGVFTVSTSDNMIGRLLFVEREFERHLMFEVARLLRSLGHDVSDGAVLDIGANMGITSVGMVKCGVVKAAIAVEPDPTNFALLKENVAQNRMDDRITIINKALSEKPGALEFELSEANFGDHRVRISSSKDVEAKYEESKRRVIRVEADTLDNVLESMPPELTSRIGFVWIDTQGHEPFVFRGGRKFFATGVPVVSELWPYGLKRSGIDAEEFCSLAAEFWTSFYVMRHAHFVRYPIAVLNTMFDELGYDGEFDNVIFINEK